MKRASRVVARIFRPGVVSAVLSVSGMAALVAFAATFGLRWALLAAAPCLLVLAAAVDGGS